MKNLATSTLLLSTLLSTTNVMAQDKQSDYGWELDNVSANVVSREVITTKAVLYETSNYQIYVGFNFPLEDCHEFSDTYESIGPISINEQMVKFSMQCVDNGLGMIFPTTQTGREFLVQEFIKRNNVTFDKDLNFPALNFTKVYKDIQNKAALKRYAI